MRRTSRVNHRSRSVRVLFALVAFSLLSMPVSYRGGAEAAHPHVFVQLWVDAANTSFDHHGRDDHQPASSAARLSAPPQSVTAIDDDAADGPALSSSVVPEVRSLALIASAWVAWQFGRIGTQAHGACSILGGRSPCPDIPPPRSAATPA